MLVLRVQVNEESPVVGGADDLGVLNAIISAVGRLGDAARPGRPDEPPDIHLTLGGLRSRAADVPDEHLRWVGHRELRVGDRILVEVLDADSADAIESGEAAKEREDDELEYFKHCKRAYLELRGKYESEG
jgi:hypothetical protein